MRAKTNLIIVFVFALLLLAVCPFFGPSLISWSDLHTNSMLEQIYFEMRLPRCFFAFLAGAGLSVGGLVFQALYRNYLASPFTLGVAAGASCGSALFMNLGLGFSWLGLSGNTYFSMLGALLTILPIYLLARSKPGTNSNEILLAGVVISLFCSSLVVFFQYISDFTQILRITRWLMGGFEVVGFETVYGLGIFVLLGSLLIFLSSRELDLFGLGDDLAASRGLDVGRVKARLFIGTSLMIGGVVSFCGPISSVGIMAPHLARYLVGFKHKVLVPATVALGGALVLLCDTFARSIIAPYEIPVGIITALIEGPFFLFLLLVKKNISLSSHNY